MARVLWIRKPMSMDPQQQGEVMNPPGLPRGRPSGRPAVTHGADEHWKGSRRGTWWAEPRACVGLALPRPLPARPAEGAPPQARPGDTSHPSGATVGHTCRWHPPRPVTGPLAWALGRRLRELSCAAPAGGEGASQLRAGVRQKTLRVIKAQPRGSEGAETRGSGCLAQSRILPRESRSSRGRENAHGVPNGAIAKPHTLTCRDRRRLPA